MIAMKRVKPNDRGNGAAPADRYAALAAVVEKYRATPFAWGGHDCCLWAATAVQAQLGADPAADLRGTYHSQRAAVALIRKKFGQIEKIPSAYGFAEQPLARSQRGWLVSKRFQRRGITLGVCVGTRAAFAGPDGLVFCSLGECRKTWRVG